MTPETAETDARGLEPYEIDGYEWELTPGSEIEDGTLIPGFGTDVYEVREKAGYSLNMEKTYRVTIMVDDGDHSFLPDFRDDSVEAMRERVNAEPFHSERDYWTLTEEE